MRLLSSALLISLLYDSHGITPSCTIDHGSDFSGRPGGAYEATGRCDTVFDGPFAAFTIARIDTFGPAESCILDFSGPMDSLRMVTANSSVAVQYTNLQGTFSVVSPIVAGQHHRYLVVLSETGRMQFWQDAFLVGEVDAKMPLSPGVREVWLGGNSAGTGVIRGRIEGTLFFHNEVGWEQVDSLYSHNAVGWKQVVSVRRLQSPVCTYAGKEFNGTDDAEDITSTCSELSLSEGVSVAFTARIDDFALDNAAYRPILDFWPTNASDVNENNLLVVVNDQGFVSVEYYDRCGCQHWLDASAVDLGSQHRYLITFDASGVMRIYVDGIPVAEQVLQEPLIALQRQVTVGGKYNQFGGFQGLIGDVQVFNEVVKTSTTSSSSSSITSTTTSSTTLSTTFSTSTTSVTSTTSTSSTTSSTASSTSTSSGTSSTSTSTTSTGTTSSSTSTTSRSTSTTFTSSSSTSFSSTSTTSRSTSTTITLSTSTTWTSTTLSSTSTISKSTSTTFTSLTSTSESSTSSSTDSTTSTGTSMSTTTSISTTVSSTATDTQTTSTGTTSSVTSGTTATSSSTSNTATTATATFSSSSTSSSTTTGTSTVTTTATTDTDTAITSIASTSTALDSTWTPAATAALTTNTEMPSWVTTPFPSLTVSTSLVSQTTGSWGSSGMFVEVATTNTMSNPQIVEVGTTADTSTMINPQIVEVGTTAMDTNTMRNPQNVEVATTAMDTNTVSNSQNANTLQTLPIVTSAVPTTAAISTIQQQPQAPVARVGQPQATVTSSTSIGTNSNTTASWTDSTSTSSSTSTATTETTVLPLTLEEQASAEVARAGREVLDRLKRSNGTFLSTPSLYGRAVSVARLGRSKKTQVSKTVTVRVGSGLQGVEEPLEVVIPTNALENVENSTEPGDELALLVSPMNISALILAGLGKDRRRESVHGTGRGRIAKAPVIGSLESGVPLAATQVELRYILSQLQVPVKDLKIPVYFTVPSVKYRKGMACMFYDEDLNMWSSEGTGVSEKNVENEAVTCWTRHFSLFAVFAKGYGDALFCARLQLFTHAAMARLAAGDWYERPGACVLWACIGLMALAFLISMAIDQRRHMVMKWMDEFFLVPMYAGPESASAPHPGSEGSLLDSTEEPHIPCWGGYLSGPVLAYLRDCLVRWCRGRVLVDACDDIAEGWRKSCGDIKNIYSGISIGNSKSRKAYKALHSMACSMVLRTSSKLASARMGLSDGVVTFVLKDKELRRCLSEQHMITDLRTVDRGWQLLETREKAWMSLHDEVCAHVQWAIDRHDSWLRCPSSVARLFLTQTAFGSMWTRHIFTSCKMRALFFSIQIVSAFLLAALFFQSSVENEEEACDEETDDHGYGMGRLVALAVVSVLLSALPRLFLNSLHRRRFKHVDYAGCPAWKRQLRAWRMEDRLIWLLGGTYLCCGLLFLMLFLANIGLTDHEDFSRVVVMAVVALCVLLPALLAVALPLATGILLTLAGKAGKKDREQLLVDVRRRLNWSTNAMLPTMQV